MESFKKIGLVIGIILFTLLIVGATYAYWVWRGNVAGVNTTLDIPLNCRADGGTHASTVALAPAVCTHERFAIKREITVSYDLFSPNSSAYMDMILTVKNIGLGLSASTNFKYALTTSDNSCTSDVIASGTFTNKTNGSTIKLFDDRIYSQLGKDIVNTYYLYIWIDAVEENPNVLNQNFEFTLSLECAQGTRITDGAAMLVNKTNKEEVTVYNDGNKVEMYTFNQPATDYVVATKDYRYIGDTPNNYVTFNNETWRIIGVFDGRIKIVKNEYVGSMILDGKQSGVGSSNGAQGSNEWNDSQMMYMLNSNEISKNVLLMNGYTFDGTYVKDANGKIIYQKGCVPVETDGTSYNCTTNSWSLSSTALSQVIDNEYYYKGLTLSFSDATGTLYYEQERNMNSKKWSGKVGLMYPSDYIYTFNYGVEDTCFNNPYSCDSTKGNLSWLKSFSTAWLLAYSMTSNNGSYAIYTNKVANYDQGNKFRVYPVVYLKPDINLSGTGTRGDPYIIIS